MADLVGLIPAAGRGVRAYPYTERMPKCLLEVDGTTLLQRNLELMRDQLGIREVTIVVGHEGERIREFVGDGSQLGLRIQLVQNDQLDRDLPYSVYLAARQIDAPCLMLLSDEFYQGTDHARLLDAHYRDAFVTCGMVESEAVHEVRKNYSVQVDGDRVLELVEKPTRILDRRMGAGTYLLHPDALRALVSDFENGPAPPDWTTWIGEQALAGRDVRACDLHGDYVNVNDREALNRANHVSRSQGFEGRQASLVYLVERVRGNLADSIRRFAEAPELHEVVVAAREDDPVWTEVAAIPNVTVFVHPEGHVPMGRLWKDALDRACGDILLTAYSDDSFSPRDLSKLLVFLQDADLVVGTRTTRQMIEQGSNMRGIVRAAHIALAKLMEVLWWSFDVRFSDVCCIYRAFWRSTWDAIRHELHEDGIESFPEMVIEVLRARRRIIEIPVNYYNRDQDRDYVWSEHQTPGTFFRILALMLRKRFLYRSAPMPRRLVSQGGGSGV